jgi:hypothetical protein
MWALTLSALIIVMGMAVSQVIISSMKTSGRLGKASQAYYAAEAAAEIAMERIRDEEVGYSLPKQKIVSYKSQETVKNQKQTRVDCSDRVNANDPSCTSPNGSLTSGNQKTFSDGLVSKYSYDITASASVEGIIPDRPFLHGDFGNQQMCDSQTISNTAPSPKLYSFPEAGRGEAGGSLCGKYDPVISCEALKKYPDIDSGNVGAGGTRQLIITDPANHPCNWGVIRPGSTVEIPLYRSLGGGMIENPNYTINTANTSSSPTANSSDKELTDFTLRFRTPCRVNSKGVRPTICADSDRETLGNDQNQEIAQWKIEAQVWKANTGVDGLAVLEGGDKDAFSNTLITPALLGADSNYVRVKNLSDEGEEDSGSVAIGLFLADPSSYKLRPKLKLSLSQPLVNDNILGSESVPYLEYQLITNKRLATPNPIITVESIHEGVRQTFTVRPSYTKSAIEYVLQ